MQRVWYEVILEEKKSAVAAAAAAVKWELSYRSKWIKIRAPYTRITSPTTNDCYRNIYSDSNGLKGMLWCWNV